jgi:uncharacterized protein YerC
MRTTMAVAALILGAALAAPPPASAADEQTTLQAISRDTGVSVETLRERKTATSLTYGNLRMAHLVAEALRRSFEDVTAEFKAGKAWHEIAGEAGLSLKEVERIARKHREASPLAHAEERGFIAVLARPPQPRPGK